MKTLRLNDDQSWLIFWSLEHEMAHKEEMAAIYFDDAVHRRFDWSANSMRSSLDEMRLCHELRAKLRPGFCQPGKVAYIATRPTLGRP